MINLSEFSNWLIEEKNFSNRSAKDVLSRIRRVRKIVKTIDMFDKYTIFLLDQSPGFENLSCSVKSQLRRSIKLLIEYQELTK